MKKTSKIISIITVLCMSMSMLTACGTEEKYDYDLSEYVKVGDYKALTYDKISVSVKKSEILDEIASRCQAKATTKSVKKGTVKNGDTINVSFEGRIDGKTFENGSSDDYDITIGQTQMIDGFTDGLIGKKVGETVTLNLKFPDDYHSSDVAGKDVVFDVNIKSKEVEVVPEYNIDFVKENSDCSTLEEYEKSVKEDLLASKEESAKDDAKSSLWNKIVAASEVIKYPEEETELEESTLESLKTEAQTNGMEWEDYLENQIGSDEEKLKEQIATYAKDQVFKEMIIYYIADQEKLSVSDKEYSDYISNMLDASGIDEDTFKANYGMTIQEYCDQQGLKTALLYGKVMEKVFEYSKEK
ncbi:MAG: trigger factor [Eubacteriaceae bacterium]|nr:trigger factor [Eubacteriaceae bacterium]